LTPYIHTRLLYVYVYIILLVRVDFSNEHTPITFAFEEFWGGASQ
jgi:hypothetical protein